MTYVAHGNFENVKMSEAGYGYVYTLPYWIFTEDADNWDVLRVDYKNYGYVVFPPHRHGKVPFVNTPTDLHLDQIPGLKSAGDMTFNPFVISIPITGEPLKANLIWHGKADKLDPKVIPKDSIRIDVIPKTGDKSQFHEADRFIRNLMELVRWKTKQWWITRSSQAVCSIGAFPFPIDEKSIPLRTQIRIQAKTSISPLYGDEISLTESIWKECVYLACFDEDQIPIYELLLHEARYNHGSGDIRQVPLLRTGTSILRIASQVRNG